MNPTELSFWLDWYDRADRALERGHGAITVYKDAQGDLHYAADEAAVPMLHEIRSLFLEAGGVKVFHPIRSETGTQVWPAPVSGPEARAALVRLIEEPAYLAQDGGFSTEEPDAPPAVCRLIDVLEARIYCAVVSEKAAERCPAWPRIVPELFVDGIAKIIEEALPCFDLLPSEAIHRMLHDLDLPIEVLTPFLPFVDKNLSLERIVVREDLIPARGSESLVTPEH